MWFGLGDDGEVRGVRACRDKRDEFRMGVDDALSRHVSPLVSPSLYDIVMTPIYTLTGHGPPGAGGATPPANARQLTDHFVIGEIC